MTPAALRRLSDQKLEDAAALASDAGRLRTQAAVLNGLLDPLALTSQRVWVGPAATDFEARSRFYAQQVNDHAARLRHIAAEFEDRARLLRTEAAAFRLQANAAEAAASTAAPQIHSEFVS